MVSWSGKKTGGGSRFQTPGQTPGQTPVITLHRGDTLDLDARTQGKAAGPKGTAGRRVLEVGPVHRIHRAPLDNIKAVLEQFGSSMDKVVKCTVFLADIGEWGAMNEVYRTYFKNPPARSALGASGLALGARVEIECIATM